MQQLAQLLPAQAPLRDFVHHNTLHAFQHLPFAEALGAAARLTRARPWLAEERCRELFRQGRVNSADLLVALRQVAASRPDELLLATPTRKLCRGEVLQAVLLYPAAAMSPARLLWQIEETPVFERLPADLDALARQRLLANAGADGRQEAVLLADLWTVARALCACAPKVDPAAAAAAAAVAVASWETMRDRLGNGWTFGELLARLSGEDFRPTLQAALIHHLAAHLDQGLAAWRNPARTRGFYAAWRQSAGRDWAWELDEFAGARHDLEQLPDDPWQLIADELLQLGVDESRWFAYLQRLVMELPGWAGMSYWRECHSRAGDPPVSLTDLLAVRVVLERLYAEQLIQHI